MSTTTDSKTNGRNRLASDCSTRRTNSSTAKGHNRSGSTGSSNRRRGQGIALQHVRQQGRTRQGISGEPPRAHDRTAHRRRRRIHRPGAAPARRLRSPGSDVRTARLPRMRLHLGLPRLRRAAWSSKPPTTTAATSANCSSDSRAMRAPPTRYARPPAPPDLRRSGNQRAHGPGPAAAVAAHAAAAALLDTEVSPVA